MYLVFDIGGTNMRAGISEDGENISKIKIIPTADDFKKGVQNLKTTGQELSNGAKFAGVGGGIAGPLDADKTMMIHSPHIKGWINKPLKSELEKEFGCRVILENDTVVGGIGEAVKGAGKGYNVVAYLAIGTGVGGKRIVDGKISGDSFNFEPGHQIIVPDGNLCKCGGKGHLEPYVSGSYFEAMYGQKGENISDPKIWDEVSRYLAIGLLNTVVFWNPDIIVLGGNVSKSIPLDKVNAYFKEFLTIYPEAPEIVKATLGDDAGLYGALELLK